MNLYPCYFVFLQRYFTRNYIRSLSPQCKSVTEPRLVTKSLPRGRGDSSINGSPRSKVVGFHNPTTFFLTPKTLPGFIFCFVCKWKRGWISRDRPFTSSISPFLKPQYVWTQVWDQDGDDRHTMPRSTNWRDS